MKPERIAYGIGERMREKGVDFSERDLKAFAASLPAKDDSPDFDALATRFTEVADRYARQRKVATRMVVAGMAMGFVGAINTPVVALTALLVNQRTGQQLDPLPWGLWGCSGLLLLLGGGAVMVCGQILLLAYAPWRSGGSGQR